MNSDASGESTACATTDLLTVTLAGLVAVPLLVAFVVLKELQKKMPDSQVLRFLVGDPW